MALRGQRRRQVMKRQHEHREVELAVGGVDRGRVHPPDGDPRMLAELAFGDRRHRRLVDVGDGQLEPSDASRAACATSRRGPRRARGSSGPERRRPRRARSRRTSRCRRTAHRSTRARGSTLRLRAVVVVAVEVLEATGFQQPVQARRSRVRPGHAVNVDDRLGHVVHDGRRTAVRRGAGVGRDDSSRRSTRAPRAPAA